MGFREAHDGSVAYRSQAPYERLAALTPLPPLLALTGALDAVVPPEHLQFYKRVPGSEVGIIEGAGHSPMVVKPKTTLELIRQFLRSPIVRRQRQIASAFGAGLDEFLPGWSGYRRPPYRSEMGGRLSAGQRGTPSFLGGLREAWLREANLP
jgi:hypothetical protein